MVEQFSVVTGNATGARIGVGNELILGRSTPGLDNAGGDVEISRVHARVFRDETGQAVIEDLGSTNGTYVNGTRIAGRHVLRRGDQVRIGKTTMSFEGGVR